MDLRQYILFAVKSHMCTSIHCTTCGAFPFRNGVAELLGLEPDPRSWSPDAALKVAAALATLNPSPDEEVVFEDPAMLLIDLVWDSAMPLRSEAMQILAGTWAGDLLGRMRRHYAEDLARAQRHAEANDPEVLAKKREEKARRQAEMLAERLQRKQERDRIWKETHGPDGTAVQGRDTIRPETR